MAHAHPDVHRAATLRWRGMPPGIPPNMAIEFMAKLKAGSTILKLTGGGRKLGRAFVSRERFNKHCELNATWAAEARGISDVNGRLGKGAAHRLTTHCKAGLHLMSGANVYLDGTHGRRRCMACRRASSAFAPLMTLEIAEKVKKALDAGASLTQITCGRPAGGGDRNRDLFIASFKIIKRYRKENPEFNEFVTTATADSLIIGQRLRYQRKRNARKREEINDYQRIHALLPSKFPEKDDVVSAIFEDLLTGSLRREDVQSRVQVYIAAHNRMYPTKYAKFGNSPLVSLEEVMFEDGSTTRGDTVSRGLWD
jgi:hypothetical protein